MQTPSAAQTLLTVSKRGAGIRAQRLVQRLASDAGSLGNIRHATRPRNAPERVGQSSRIVLFENNRDVLGNCLFAVEMFGNVKLGQVGNFHFLGHGSILKRRSQFDGSNIGGLCRLVATAEHHDQDITAPHVIHPPAGAEMLPHLEHPLCYAEFAAMVPVAGSAYTYGYVALGEFWAWVIGWDLILEYAFAVSAVAIGWSGYFNNIHQLGPRPAEALTLAPYNGGIVNLPAVLILCVIAFINIHGVRQSATVNNIIVGIKLAVVALVPGFIGFSHVDAANWVPFMPYGWSGVFAGASIIFFAYIGFDAVSTAAEEVKNPQKDLPRGIILSLIICTVLYIAVSAVLTGMVPYLEFKTTAAPVAFALQAVGYHWGAAAISVGAICGLTSVLLVMSFWPEPRTLRHVPRWPAAEILRPRPSEI